jgi:hypothetical protein
MENSLFQVAANDFDEGLGGIFIEGTRMLLRIDEVMFDMLLDNLSHQAGDRAANPCNEVQHLLTTRLVYKGALDGINQAADSTNARDQFFFMLECMAHELKYSLPPYSIQV